LRFRRRHPRADADRGGELAVPVRSDLLARCASSAPAPSAAPAARSSAPGEQLQTCLRQWPEREDLLAPQQQRLDELAERLPRALRGRLDRARGELGHAGGALRPGLLVAAHRRARERLDALWRVALLAHPNRPLERGYARVEDRDGHTLISAEAARQARLLRLIFHDGRVEAAVGDAGGKAPRRALASGKPDQPKLL
jgi:exodeoxyribonuclease VII large subunit